MNKKAFSFFSLLIFGSSFLVVIARPNTEVYWEAFNECSRQASLLYPYDGQIIDPRNPPPSYQAQQYCHYLLLQYLGGKPQNPITDPNMMDKLNQIFKAQLDPVGLGTIKKSLSSGKNTKAREFLSKFQKNPCQQ